jgi:YHS domain-containing protein
MLSFLVRLIVFMIAISAIRAVVNYIRRLWMANPPARSYGRPPGRAQQQQAGPTVLQQDPVCGTYVAIDSSLKKLVGGRVIHFCSAECRDRYNA